MKIILIKFFYDVEDYLSVRERYMQLILLKSLIYCLLDFVVCLFIVVIKCIYDIYNFY